MELTIFLQYLLGGIVTGAFLTRATIGFSLTRRVEGFLNIAHAELLGVAAFTTWGLNKLAGLPFIPSAAVGIVATAFLGLWIGRLVYDPIRAYEPAVLLITSVGMAYVLSGAKDAIIGTDIRTLDIPLATTCRMFGLNITDYQIAVGVLAALTSASLALFLGRAKTGLAARALADNPEPAASRGIDVKQTSRGTWLLASGLAGLAGLAGVMLSIIATLSTDIAFLFRRRRLCLCHRHAGAALGARPVSGGGERASVGGRRGGGRGHRALRRHHRLADAAIARLVSGAHHLRLRRGVPRDPAERAAHRQRLGRHGE